MASDTVADTRLHVILGPAESDPFVSTPITETPDYHSHPLLDIDGHWHDDGRRLHGHRPEITWGAAVYIEGGDSQ